VGRPPKKFILPFTAASSRLIKKCLTELYQNYQREEILKLIRNVYPNEKGLKN
jgi:hypothetical protein